MTLTTALIVTGHAVLLWQFRGWGVLAIVAHLLFLLACVPRE